MKMHPVGKPSANFQNKQLRYWSANRNRFSLYLGRTMTAYCKLYQDYFKFKKSDCQAPGCKNNCISGVFLYPKPETGNRETCGLCTRPPQKKGAKVVAGDSK